MKFIVDGSKADQVYKVKQEINYIVRGRLAALDEQLKNLENDQGLKKDAESLWLSIKRDINGKTFCTQRDHKTIFEALDRAARMQCSVEIDLSCFS